MLTADWKCEIEINTRTAIAKESFNKEKHASAFASIDLQTRKDLVKCCVCGVFCCIRNLYPGEESEGYNWGSGSVREKLLKWNEMTQWAMKSLWTVQRETEF